MPLNSIAWIGRLTGPKGEIAQRIVNEVAPRFPDIKFTIVGGPENEPMRKAAGNNVAFLGFVEDVTAVIESHDLVIGAGRVALEAMRKRVPVIAVGESQYIGPISEATVNQAKASNFGDCAHPQPWTARQMADDISRIARGELSLPLAHYAEYLRDYAADEVYGKVLEVYRRARIDAYLGRYREIPVLTYHRIPQTRPSDSKFNIYVTVDELDWQIKNLKQRGFEFITFNEIADGVQVKKPVILTFDDGYECN